MFVDRIDRLTSAAKLCYCVTSIQKCGGVVELLHQNDSAEVYSFSGLLGLNHRPVFADTKAIIRVLCFNQLVVYSTRNSIVDRSS